MMPAFYLLIIVTREERVMPYFKSSFPRKGERYNSIETSENQTNIADTRAAGHCPVHRDDRFGYASA
jgi:hypothetical protein